MQAVKETTIWEGDIQANHVYLLDGDKMVAYIKFGKGKPFYFSKPIQIDRRGRKFEDLADNPFTVTVSNSEVTRVQGSKGAVYEVNKQEGTCTCPGFQFRGKCKHLE